MALQTADDRTSAALLAGGALLAAVATVLAGCVARREPAPPGSAAESGPGPIASGMGFFLDRNEDEGWKLAYGQANTDNVQLMLACKPGSRRIELFDAGHAPTRNGAVLVLTSGKVQSALTVTVEPDEASADGAVAIAHTTPDLPALDGFRRTGAIAVKLGPREYSLTATPAEKSQIARFFSGCERK